VSTRTIQVQVWRELFWKEKVSKELKGPSAGLGNMERHGRNGFGRRRAGSARKRDKTRGGIEEKQSLKVSPTKVGQL